MILNDYTKEYLSLNNYLNECTDYVENCKILIDKYLNGTISYTKRYYSSGTSSRNNDLSNDLSKQTNEIYTLIKVLNAKSLPLSMALGKLNLLNEAVKNKTLKEDLKKYADSAYSSIELISGIILNDINGVRTGELLKNLFDSIENLILLHESLTSITTHLAYIENGLLEPIPQNISTEELSMLELRSEKRNISFSEVANDLSLLSSFLSNFEHIRDISPDHPTCFVRKIETGSLRIVWGGTTVELSCISDIIQAVTNAIKTFRLTGVEKRIKEEEANSLKLDNEAKALSIINTQIDTICQKINLDPSNPEDIEAIQRMCLPLVKYINSNPIGYIGDFQYNLSDEVKLLEDTYFSTKE